MIDKLTKEQEELIPVYLNKWLDVGYRTKTMNRGKTKAAIEFLYKDILKMKSPEIVIYLDSPMACQLAVNLMKGTKFESKNLWAQLYSQLGSQLGSQLRSQLDSQLDSQLYSQLRSQLSFQLRSQRLEYNIESHGNWWYRTAYYGLYDFVLNEIFPDKANEFKLFVEYLKNSNEIHYLMMFENLAIVSDFPSEINLNSDHRLHSYDKAALLYRDSYSLYYSNGIAMKKEYIEASKDQVTKEMILSEENADIRREIVRKIGNEKMIEVLNPSILDEFEGYKLFGVDLGDKRVRPFLYMKNPSIDLIHVEGVHPDIKTVKEALSWRNGLDKYEAPQALS